MRRQYSPDAVAIGISEGRLNRENPNPTLDKTLGLRKDPGEATTFPYYLPKRTENAV